MSVVTHSIRKRPLAVEWHEAVWQPVILVRRSHRRRGIKPLLPQGFLKHPASRHNRIQTMKPTLFLSRRSHFGFTLVELLVVIAIIGILAAMLLPVITTVSKKAKEKKARMEVQSIATAIESYDSAYGRFPVSKAAQDDAGLNKGDFTYGGPIRFDATTAPFLVSNPGGYTYNTSNAEVVAILMDLTSTPTGLLTVNTNHVKNPRQTKFLNATMTGDPTLPGVGPDLVYRDPWGNPYIISLDLNYDEQCKDAFYCLSKVANVGGLNTNPGLVSLANPDTTKADNFQFHGKVMVWSAGADKKIDSGISATAGVNKDNILSWQ